MSGKSQNEGEGSRSGAKAYDESTRKFVDSGRVGAAAEAAMKARDGSGRAALDLAEAEGKSHSKGEDHTASLPGDATQDGAIDYQSALVNPADLFAEPSDVVTNPSLSAPQKRKILAHWDLDARQLSVAEEENMAGGEESMVGRVSRAILALGGATELEPGGVTKVG